MTKELSSCRKCGHCCERGGPALHSEDLDLIRSGKIPISSLITIRKGELVHNPITDKIQAAGVELVKLVGTGREWNCCYYDKRYGCTIYDYRPQACRALKCWDSAELLALVEKDTLDRLAILKPDDPLIPVILEHEKICPCDDLQSIRDSLGELSETRKAEIEKRVRQDLRFRHGIIKGFDLNLAEELFYFGRPLFQLLQPFGVQVYESNNEVYLKW